MRRFVLIVIFLLFVTHISAGNRWAVVVGINVYAKESGWGRISGAEDIDIVVPMLHNIGFEDNGITILADSMATKANIKKTILIFHRFDIIV